MPVASRWSLDITITPYRLASRQPRSVSTPVPLHPKRQTIAENSAVVLLIKFRLGYRSFVS